MTSIKHQSGYQSLRAHRDGVIDAWHRVHFQPSRVDRYQIEGAGPESVPRLKAAFVEPLFELFLSYLETGESRYRDVYLDERLRYAPHQASPSIRREFFSEVLEEDAGVLADILGGEWQELEKTWIGLHESLREASTGDSIRLLTLGDCVMNDLRVFLIPASRALGIDLDMRELYFSALIGRELSTAQAERFLAQNPMDLIACSFFTYEGIPPYVALLRDADRLRWSGLDGRVDALVGLAADMLNRLREKTDAPFLLHDACGLPLGRWRRRLPILPPISYGRQRMLKRLNSGLAELAEATPNCLLISESEVVRREGHRACSEEIVPARIAQQAMFHTARFGSLLASHYVEALSSFRDLRKAKVLLVDFDNTLWDGVMADGQVIQHKDRQELLLKLKESGIVLVAVSKNDPKNIRWDEMVLSPDDFALKKISWDIKVKSIELTAQELDLGMDSFVFIDDSPQEREFVRSALPSVINFDATLASTWRALARLLEFPNTRDTAEARARTEMYRAQAERRKATSGSVDFESMLGDLGLVLRFGVARTEDLDRVTELVQRTNQFNTTTIRYDRSQLEEFVASAEQEIYVANLADRFGDFGLVVVVIVEREDSRVVFNSFIMSCRAMGYGVEQVALSRVMEAEGAGKEFVGVFRPSDRNDPASGLYGEAGFTQDGTETELWKLSAAKSPGVVPAWIRIEART
ncbi:MAG: HAD-IIIC family phosphatase [Myxococcota bacterium]|nr:HAD-IIIC family phosphatase [Myxococcota bacterium]